jgi:hypothetical protein
MKENPIIIYDPDGQELIRLSDPATCKYLRARAREYNRQHGTCLSVEEFIVKTWEEVLFHPVKSLRFGSTKEKDQLAPSDLLPFKVGEDSHD